MNYIIFPKDLKITPKLKKFSFFSAAFMCGSNAVPVPNICDCTARKLSKCDRSYIGCEQQDGDLDDGRRYDRRHESLRSE